MEITVNGAPVQIHAGDTLYRIKYFIDNTADIMIVNGWQTGDDMRLKDGDVVYLIKRGAMPPKDQLEHMMAARHTPNVHNKLKAAKVAIAGLGGLGSNIAVMLSRIGVGQLLLVDFDIVEPSNLNRQSYYVRHLGMKKTHALQQLLLEINPFGNVEMRNAKVTQENVGQLFGSYEIVCEAFDDPQTKAMLVQTLLMQQPDTKVVAASGMAGYDSANSVITQRRMKNLYVCGDQETEAREGCGLMAPRVTLCAAHQANMVLRLILGIEEV